MQVWRSVLLAVLIVLFIYFEIHSCSENRLTDPNGASGEPENVICDADGVYFLTGELGWVIGSHGTIMKTADGGTTWEGVRIEDVKLNDVFFIDRHTGWVVGKGGCLYRSDDGGQSWERIFFSGIPSDDDLYQVYFAGKEYGYVQGYHGVFRTGDGGTMWENHWLPVVPYRGAWAMSFVDSSTGYLLGSRWAEPDPILIYMTADGGLTWSAVAGSESSVLKSVMTVHFVNEQTGWAGGTVIMKTADGARQWSKQLDGATVRQLYFVDGACGYAVGGLQVLRTRDGGATWIDVTPEDDRIVDLRAVFFIDTGTGWIVGRGKQERTSDRIYRHSIVMKTTDGGESWNVRDFLFDYTEYYSTAEVTGESAACRSSLAPGQP